MSDLEDNTFKISVPIITNEELERFEYSLETDLDNIVNEISTHISRDREIILLKKVIEKQQKEIEELKKPKYNINCKTNEITKLTNDFVSKDKIKAKIEEIKNECKYCDFADEICEELLQNNNCTQGNTLKVLQSLLEKE